MADNNQPIPPTESPTVVYKRWLASQAAFKDKLKELFGEYAIPAVETRVANFLEQLGSHLKDAAHKETFGG